MSRIILSSAYLPSAQYISKINASSNILLEQHEHFVKQSYRNRCYILSANGPLCLSIPILHSNSVHTVVKDVKISYDFNWQKIHWKSIESGYRCSPFFEYYEDELSPFYKKNFSFLFDFNEQLLSLILKFLKITGNPFNFRISY